MNFHQIVKLVIKGNDLYWEGKVIEKKFSLLIQYIHPCHLVQKGLLNTDIKMRNWKYNNFNNSQIKIQTLFLLLFLLR